MQTTTQTTFATNPIAPEVTATEHDIDATLRAHSENLGLTSVNAETVGDTWTMFTFTTPDGRTYHAGAYYEEFNPHMWEIRGTTGDHTTYRGTTAAQFCAALYALTSRHPSARKYAQP
jgi:hypothetical protein